MGWGKAVYKTRGLFARTHITASDPAGASVPLHGIYAALTSVHRASKQRSARCHCFPEVIGTLGAVALLCAGRKPELVRGEDCVHALHVFSALTSHCRRPQPAAVQNRLIRQTHLRQRSSSGSGALRVIPSCVSRARSRSAPWRLVSCTVYRVETNT